MTDVDLTIASVWRRVLATSDAGRREDFYAQGGDAVDAAELLALLQDAFDVEVTAEEFLAGPTIAGLAATVKLHLEASPERRGESDVAPVGFSQEGMLWYEQFSPGSFNMAPFVRHYEGVLQVEALRLALSDIIERHAPLRTTFKVIRGRPTQRIRPPQVFALPVTDLGPLDPDRQRAEVSSLVAAAAQRPFELAEDPLFEPTLLRLGETDHVLIVRLHHLVFDDWAVDIFRRELSASYRAHATGEPAAFAELAISFPEFCRRQRRRLAGPTGTDELGFWKRELLRAPWTCQLPIEDPRRPQGSPHRAVGPVYYPLPPLLVDALRTVARHQRTTLFMALLAVFGVATYSSTGQDDLVLASVVANRNRAELEDLIGCFTKKIVVRLNLQDDPTFAELAGRARDSLLRSLAHQDLPFETVVQRVLGPAAADHGLVPQVTTMFQAETPRREKVELPGLTVGGYDTDTPIEQAHFSSGPSAAPAAIWGAGLYRATFLILSVLEASDGVSLVARGAFHPPAVDKLVARFEALLAQVVADPSVRLSQLVSREPAAGPTTVDLGGYPVDLRRIEASLARHAGVREVAVTVRRDLGDGPRVVAYLVAEASPSLTLSSLRSHLWQDHPGYAWPAHVVVVGALSRREDGRVDFRALPSPDPSNELSPAPDQDNDLASRWGRVLGTGGVRADANYWQRFSFLDVVRDEGRSGPIESGRVMRNRTLRTLATDLAGGVSSADGRPGRRRD